MLIYEIKDADKIRHLQIFHFDPIIIIISWKSRLSKSQIRGLHLFDFKYAVERSINRCRQDLYEIQKIYCCGIEQVSKSLKKSLRLAKFQSTVEGFKKLCRQDLEIFR